MLLGLLEERDDAEDAGGVDEHVDAAEALDGERDERLRLLAGGDLAGVDCDALAARVERVARGLELGLAGAAEDDARALGEEARGGGAADAATTAGDQDDLVLVLRMVSSSGGEMVHVHRIIHAYASSASAAILTSDGRWRTRPSTPGARSSTRTRT